MKRYCNKTFDVYAGHLLHLSLLLRLLLAVLQDLLLQLGMVRLCCMFSCCRNHPGDIDIQSLRLGVCCCIQPLLRDIHRYVYAFYTKRTKKQQCTPLRFHCNCIGTSVRLQRNHSRTTTKLQYIHSYVLALCNKFLSNKQTHARQTYANVYVYKDIL